MNLVHLGDALDFWKCNIFCRLRSRRLLRGLVVLPLPTDDLQWQQAERDAYARFLGVEPEAVHLWNDRFISSAKEARSQYLNRALEGVSGDSDIFVDPDTGLRPEPRAVAPGKHITYDEIATLLPRQSSRIVAVYDHTKTRDNNVTEVQHASAIVDKFHGLNLCALVLCCRQVRMVFVSRSDTDGAKRIADIKRYWCELFGGLAASRIIGD